MINYYNFEDFDWDDKKQRHDHISNLMKINTTIYFEFDESLSNSM